MHTLYGCHVQDSSYIYKDVVDVHVYKENVFTMVTHTEASIRI